MYKARKLDLVILAGGKGARISKYLKGIPKPMIKFKGIPFLQYQINKFFKYPFINCYILSGYRGKIIDTISNILGGIRSSCTYVGAPSLKQLSKCTTFVRVSNQFNDTFAK